MEKKMKILNVEAIDFIMKDDGAYKEKYIGNTLLDELKKFQK